MLARPTRFKTCLCVIQRRKSGERHGASVRQKRETGFPAFDADGVLQPAHKSASLFDTLPVPAKIVHEIKLDGTIQSGPDNEVARYAGILFRWNWAVNSCRTSRCPGLGVRCITLNPRMSAFADIWAGRFSRPQCARSPTVELFDSLSVQFTAYQRETGGSRRHGATARP
ncbi:hypothetical protein [Caballeronia sordidicola]|uniref:hypothetical protein n=1 Tax=Caballeronia sordidicola TaxID=196367 RepID=UPI000B78A6A3|nr:hypothetical protein [Caballeronia sordidicola]